MQDGRQAAFSWPTLCKDLYYQAVSNIRRILPSYTGCSIK